MDSFDFTNALPKRTQSPNTQRAYYRWVDRYLVDVAGLKATRGEERLTRMQNLPVKSLQRHMTQRKFINWLNRLVEDGQGRQALDQARATIVTLSDLMAEDDMLERDVATEIQSVSVPSIKKNPTPDKLLTPDEVKRIMVAARDMATSNNQMLRNNVVALTLCTMALRREELSAAKWRDITMVKKQVVLSMNDTSFVDMPVPVVTAIDRWRAALGNPPEHTSIIRRIWKGGRIAKAGLSPDGIWLIIRNASQYAGLGHVTPDDLRRSAVANMYKNGMPVEEISRLLRHRSVLITERFLAKLPLGDS
ncbi:MAG: tyrosine-type recombinase/integrase [Chloroflexota bacterium]